MDVKSIVTQGFGRGLLLGKKHSPEILTIAGIAGLVTSGVLAARATLKLEAVVDEHRTRVEALREDSELILASGDEVAIREYKKDLLYVYSNTTWELTKIYGPAVTLATASTVGILVGQNILKKRNLALIGAYKALESSFDAYRKRVVEEYGTEVDRDIAFGVRREKVEDKETGKKKEVVTVDSGRNTSMYGRIFDETNDNWNKIAEYNLMNLKNIQNWANDRLLVQGHLFLNEVYDMLGFEHTTAGAVVGWVVGKDGDNYVDFGIFEHRNSVSLNNPSSRADNWFLLDFNVDGVIYDKI